MYIELEKYILQTILFKVLLAFVLHQNEYPYNAIDTIYFILTTLLKTDT